MKFKRLFHDISEGSDLDQPPSKQPKYQCTIRNAKPKESKAKNIRHHKELKHEGVKYPCDQCDYVATNSSNQKRHKNAMHEGVRYPCDQCDYAATVANDLKRHKESKHEGVRYPCDQCDYMATRAEHLKKHKRSQHNLKLSK